MPDIKTKNSIKGRIETLDKKRVFINNTRSKIKDKSEQGNTTYENANSYAIDKLKESGDNFKVLFNETKQVGNNAVKETKNNIIKTKSKINDIKTKIAVNKVSKKTPKDNGVSRLIKLKNKESKKKMKQMKQARKKAVEASKRTYKGIKLTIKIIKSIISSAKALIAALIAGGWIAILIIIIICMIGLLCGSFFGIFFSSEDKNANITMNNVVSTINNNVNLQIEKTKKNNLYDEYRIISNRASWQEVLAIYTAKISNGEDNQDVMTLDKSKVKVIEDIFWDMNTITYEIKNELYIDESINKERLSRILYIKINGKSLETMMNSYNFNDKQREQVNELLKDEYISMWGSAIYGTPLGNNNFVKIALSQVGNVGGEPYWSWYGYSQRVEWCAVFVSWVAYQSGYLDIAIPKFAGCETGVDWFKAMDKWQERGYVPKSGDIIFFDWEDNGYVNHVGIVEKVIGNTIYTIEGNSTDDTCRQKTYSIDSNVIFGYGIPSY